MYMNIGLSDMRAALNHFTKDTEYFESDKLNRLIDPRPREWIKAVKISCSGDIALRGKKKYRQILIRSSAEIFDDSADTCSISKHIGLELLVQQDPLNEKYRDAFKRKEIEAPYDNTEMAFLVMDARPSEMNETWGAADIDKWDSGRESSVVVAGANKKNISHILAETG